MVDSGIMALTIVVGFAIFVIMYLSFFKEVPTTQPRLFTDHKRINTNKRSSSFEKKKLINELSTLRRHSSLYLAEHKQKKLLMNKMLMLISQSANQHDQKYKLPKNEYILYLEKSKTRINKQIVTLLEAKQKINSPVENLIKVLKLEKKQIDVMLELSTPSVGNVVVELKKLKKLIALEEKTYKYILETHKDLLNVSFLN